MSTRTAIEWADSTFNPWIGCTKISPACDNCYAERDFDLRKHVVKWGAGQPRKRTSAQNWRNPVKWNAEPFYECGCGSRGTMHDLTTNAVHSCDLNFKHARRRVMCASLADIFDNEVDVPWRRDLFNLILSTPNLDWLLPTKRIGNATRMIEEVLPESMRKLPSEHPLAWPWPHVWIGATICNQEEANRDIPKLLATPAAVRFLSIEPLLGPISLRWLAAWPDHASGRRATHPTGTTNDLDGLRRLDWIIVGGESGPHARPMHPEWVRSLRDQCAAAGVPFLFKQWGEFVPRSACYHTFEDGKSCVDYDPSATRWPVIRLNENGTDGRRLENECDGDSASMQRVGKKTAGRLLDGRTHDEYPRGAE